MELRDVQRRNVEATRFDARAGAWEGSGKNDRATECQSIGGVRLVSIDIEPFKAGERSGVKPGAVGKERVAAEMGDGGLQMKTAGDGDGDDFVMVRSEDGGKLADAFGVAACSEADEELAADAKNIATLESPGKKDVFQLSKLGEGLSERRGLATASLRSEGQDHCQFIENDCGIFDKHGVRKTGFGTKRNNAGTQFAQQLLVGMVLLPGGGQIDGLAVNEGKLAIDDGRADGTGDGSEHGKQRSLHEILLRRGAGVYRLAIQMK